MTLSGDRMPVSVTAAPVAVSPRSGAAPGSTAPGSTTPAARPPWWCAHRSRSSALGVLSTAVLVCLASVVAVIGFVSTGSTIAALVALGVLAVGAANVVSGSFGAAWWARRARTSVEVTSMNSTDDRHRPGETDTRRGGDLPRRPAPVVPAAREPRTPAGGGRHAWADPADEPTTRIPTPPPAQAPPPPQAPQPPQGLQPPPRGTAPGHAVSPPTPGPPAGGPGDPTEALPIQDPYAAEADDRPASSTGTVRAAAKRAASRPANRSKRVAGRPPSGPADQR